MDQDVRIESYTRLFPVCRSVFLTGALAQLPSVRFSYPPLTLSLKGRDLHSGLDSFWPEISLLGPGAALSRGSLTYGREGKLSCTCPELAYPGLSSVLIHLSIYRCSWCKLGWHPNQAKSVSKPHVSIVPHISNYSRFSAIQQNFNLFLLSGHSSKPEGYKGTKTMATREL